MRLLLHPLVMPLYTLTLFVEIERQSYVIDYIQLLLILYGYIIGTTLYEILLMKKISDDPSKGLWHRIIAAIYLTAIYAFEAYSCNMLSRITFTWGLAYTTTIYIIPAWLNVFCGAGMAQIAPRLSQATPAKANAIPPANIGALAGYTIMMGMKTGADTFWPFVLTLLMAALHSTLTTPDDPKLLRMDTCMFAAGAAQSIIIMA